MIGVDVHRHFLDGDEDGDDDNVLLVNGGGVQPDSSMINCRMIIKVYATIVGSRGSLELALLPLPVIDLLW